MSAILEISTNQTNHNKWRNNIIVHMCTVMDIPQGWCSACPPCFELHFETKNINKYSYCMFLSTTCSDVHGFVTERTRECQLPVCQRSCEVITVSEIISFFLCQSYQNVCCLADYLTFVLLTVISIDCAISFLGSLSLAPLGRKKRVPGNELRLMKPLSMRATNTNVGHACLWRLEIEYNFLEKKKTGI